MNRFMRLFLYKTEFCSNLQAQEKPLKLLIGGASGWLSVKCPTLDFGSGHLTFVGSSPTLSPVLRAQSLLGILCLPLSSPPPVTHSLSLIKKIKKLIKAFLNKEFQEVFEDLAKRQQSCFSKSFFFFFPSWPSLVFIFLYLYQSSMTFSVLRVVQGGKGVSFVFCFLFF